MLSGSELWLLRLMADRGLALLDAGTLLVVIEERGELRVAASSGQETVRLRIVPVQGSALGDLYRQGKPVSLDRPRGQDAAWLHELGLEARAALVEPLSMEGYGGGLVIALRRDGGFRGPDREALRHELRRFDRVGRPSEGELAVLLPGADGPRGEIVARRALQRLRAIKVEAGGQRRPLRVSVGMAAWQGDVDGEQLLAQTRAAARRENGLETIKT